MVTSLGAAICLSFYGARLPQPSTTAVHANLRCYGGIITEWFAVIFKGVREGKPYPEHGLSTRDWSRIPPRQIRLDELVTTTTVLALDRLLSEDSTFYGDLFPHAVKWQGVTYLEDGLHRAVRAALRNRVVLHARVFDMDQLRSV